MSLLFDDLSKKQVKDMRVLANFISIFCRHEHPAVARGVFSVPDERMNAVLKAGGLELCAECQRLLSYGIAKLLLCPYDPKPACKKCPTPCYAPSYRRRIRQMMRFSGMYLIRRGRVDLIFSYLW